MIGSHDSFTFMKARNPLMNLIKGTWRTQDKSIEEQYKSGVRFFDIRLFRDGNKWRAAHGLAEFDVTFTSLGMVKELIKTLPGARFQIWLEKGSDEDWKLFKTEVAELTKRYKWALTQVVRKKPWEIYYRCENFPGCEYLAFRDWSWKNVLKGLVCSPIRKWAQEKNVDITKERMSEEKVYFMDFI